MIIIIITLTTKQQQQQLNKILLQLLLYVFEQQFYTNVPRVSQVLFRSVHNKTQIITLDYIRYILITFLCPNAMHGKLGAAFLGGKRAISTALPRFLLFKNFFTVVSCVQCFCVSIPPAVRPTIVTTDGYGIFNVRTHLDACRVILTKGVQEQISVDKS